MNKERVSLLFLLALALAAAGLVLRRRQEAPEGPSLPPPPEPPEPPRIVLPQSVLEEQEEQKAAEEQAPVQEQETAEEPPLRERAVGEPLEQAPSAEGTAETGEQIATEEENAEGEIILGYCMHCRERRTIVGGEEVTTESGRRALSGACQVCGTRIFRFLPSKEQDRESQG
ncbi:MAG: hypothetical protein KatS3mg057_1810 [Herpetosiphonaceae bacterium]|nr:MAG: hypothetical protein KatS3mg057_1810 [Herpetosiphonaceae bacterium]